MSILKLLPIPLLALLIITGCDNNTGEPDNTPTIYDSGSMAEDCCGVIYYQSVSGNSPGAYVYMVLEYQGRAVSYGNAVWVEGEYTELLSVSSAYVNLPSEELFKKVYMTTEPEDIGFTEKSHIARDAYPVGMALADTGCSACCTKTLRRYAIWAIKKGLDSLTGVSAEIETHWNMLCPDYEQHALSAAWVGLQNDLPPATFTNFVQMGYMTWRRPGYGTDSLVYVEFRGEEDSADYWHIDCSNEIPPPYEGDFHHYKSEVNSSNGTVMFWYDGSNIYNISAPWWSGRTCRYPSWRCEIDGRESDMGGTSQDPLYFNDCEYRQLNGSYQWANFGEIDDWIQATPQLYDPDQWGISYAHHSLSMWDNYPLGTVP